MINPKTRKCNDCQSEKIVVTRIEGLASVIQTLDQKSAILMEICTDCGKVINHYAEHPAKLKGEK